MSFCPRAPTWGILAPQNGSFEIPKIGTPTILGAHNFVCKPLIEMRFKTKL